MSRQYYTLYNQIIDVSEEDKMKEIETFIKKYHLDYKRSLEIPKAKPIWQIFFILAMANTMIGIITIFYETFNMMQFLMGYFIVGILYIGAYISAKSYRYNIKVN